MLILAILALAPLTLSARDLLLSKKNPAAPAAQPSSNLVGAEPSKVPDAPSFEFKISKAERAVSPAHETTFHAKGTFTGLERVGLNGLQFRLGAFSTLFQAFEREEGATVRFEQLRPGSSVAVALDFVKHAFTVDLKVNGMVAEPDAKAIELDLWPTSGMGFQGPFKSCRRLSIASGGGGGRVFSGAERDVADCRDLVSASARPSFVPAGYKGLIEVSFGRGSRIGSVSDNARLMGEVEVFVADPEGKPKGSALCQIPAEGGQEELFIWAVNRRCYLRPKALGPGSHELVAVVRAAPDELISAPFKVEIQGERSSTAAGPPLLSQGECLALGGSATWGVASCGQGAVDLGKVGFLNVPCCVRERQADAAPPSELALQRAAWLSGATEVTRLLREGAHSTSNALLAALIRGDVAAAKALSDAGAGCTRAIRTALEVAKGAGLKFPAGLCAEKAGEHFTLEQVQVEPLADRGKVDVHVRGRLLLAASAFDLRSILVGAYYTTLDSSAFWPVKGQLQATLDKGVYRIDLATGRFELDLQGIDSGLLAKRIQVAFSWQQAFGSAEYAYRATSLDDCFEATLGRWPERDVTDRFDRCSRRSCLFTAPPPDQ